MRPDTLKRVRVATDIVDNPKHLAWDTIRQRMEADLATDTSLRWNASGRLDILTTLAHTSPKEWHVDMDWLAAGFEDPPLVVLGQGTSKRVYNGDDFGTNNAPLRESVVRLWRAALSFLRVR